MSEAEELAPPVKVTIKKGGESQQLISTREVHLNTAQNLVITTEDKLRICLTDYAKHSDTASGWIAPLGILAAIITTLVTSDFKDFVVPAATWQAFFMLSGVGSGIWLVKAAWAAWKARVDIETLIRMIKIETSQSTDKQSGGT